ncbi:MAG: CpaF family protein [Candidatus Omnitrophica bacterium]|nr:CpaF family protein [Candidatus Omnitrophota bacterium]
MAEKNIKIIKERIQENLFEALPRNFYEFDEPLIKRTIESAVNSAIRQNRYSLGRIECETLIDEITSEILGLGPLERLLKDPSICEIMVNGPKQVYVERQGKLELTDIKFKDEKHIMFFTDKILAPLGRRATQLDPYVDARLKDGSRVNVVKSPISLYGTAITIRKFTYQNLTIDDLIGMESLDRKAADFLKACVEAHLNIIVSGGTSSGKTTLVGILASFIDKHERLITIEDTVELHLADRHKVCLESRPINIEGKGEIKISDLVKNALHMRPDRIIIGEVRSGESVDMLQAMNTGQVGSMATVHSNSPYDTILRLETMTLMGKPNFTSEVVRRQIISAVDLIVHQIRRSDGTRRTSNITEVIKTADWSYKLEDIFNLQTTKDLSSERKQQLLLTGTKPTFYSRLKIDANYSLPDFEK